VSYPETKDWRVIDVREGKTEPNPHGGQFQKFYVDFEGAPDTYWRRSAGDVPEVGHNYFGTVSQGDYGLRFKKEKKPDGYEASTGTSGGSSNSSKGQSKGDVDWDVRNAEIRRQHSQEMALRFVMHPLPENFVLADLKTTIDWFDQDAIEAGQKASGEAPVDFSGARKEEPDPVAAIAKEFDATPVYDDSHQFIANELNVGGASLHSASVLATFAVEKLLPNQRQTLEGELRGDDSSKNAALKRIEDSYLKAEGHPVPAPQDDPTIPF
jgi:hypothetical protein